MNSRSLFIRSRVIPFFPGFREAGLSWVSFEATDELVGEEDESAEEAVVVPV